LLEVRMKFAQWQPPLGDNSKITSLQWQLDNDKSATTSRPQRHASFLDKDTSDCVVPLKASFFPTGISNTVPRGDMVECQPTECQPTECQFFECRPTKCQLVRLGVVSYIFRLALGLVGIWTVGIGPDIVKLAFSQLAFGQLAFGRLA
jgi:hypothetical protein